MTHGTSEADQQLESTLYDPSPEGAEEVASGEDEEELHLKIPEHLAKQLLDVALHLGLTPSVVASRAIDMVCDEVGLVEDQELSSGTLIQKYQTRLDLLHTLDFGVETEDDDDEMEEPFGWEAVDEIIETGEQARG